jgi:hypothetical protein
MRRTLLRTLRVLTLDLGTPCGLPVQRMRCTLRRATYLIQHAVAPRAGRQKIFAEQLAILRGNLLHREASYFNMRPRCDVWYRS